MIKLYNEQTEIPFKSFIFPGGEPHVEIPDLMNHRLGNLNIDARITNMNELATLLVLTDAVRQAYPSHLILFLPYFPGARQDRIELRSGTALTARVFANIINAQKYDVVFLLDPHSDVVPALVDRSFVFDHLQFVEKYIAGKDIDCIINPDAGAAKRNQRIAQKLNLPTLTADKHRDPKTGRITMGFHVDVPSEHENFLILDDLCDGGMTFKLLEEAFINHYPRITTRHLWVTHGIFSGNFIDNLKYYSTIGSTDSWWGVGPATPKFEVHKLEPAVLTFT